METKSFDSLGLPWPLSVPSTVAEYDAMAKRENAALQDAIVQTVYHSTLGDIRANFCARLEWELTKKNAERKANNEPEFDISWDSGRKTAEGEVIELNEAAWVNKVLAVSGTKIADWAFLQDDVLNGWTKTYTQDGKSVTETIEGTKFDPSTAPRKAGILRLSKASLTAAETLIKQLGARSAELAKKLEGLNPEIAKKAEFEENGTPKKEYLARLITAEEARKRAQVNLASEYAGLV